MNSFLKIESLRAILERAEQRAREFEASMLDLEQTIDRHKFERIRKAETMKRRKDDR